MSEAGAAPEPTATAPQTRKQKRRERRKNRKPRDGWTLLEKFFGLATAFLALLTAAVGIWGSQAASERNDLKEEASTLESDTDDLQAERDDLVDQLDTATKRIEELEEQADEPPSSPPTTDDGGVTPGPIGQQQQLLTELDAVDGQGQWQVATGAYINEVLHDSVLYSSAVSHCSSTSRTIEYSLRAQYDTLTAAVGVTEKSVAGLDVRVDMIGDDRQLWTGTFRIGQKQDISVDVSGVIRFKLVVTALFGRGDCSDAVAAALGDPTLKPS